MDPRCTRSRQRVLAAAVEVLRDDGLPGLSFEAVATRSGVAKTTIYRHFPDREVLHAAAVESVGPQIAMPTTDDVESDLVEFLESVDHSMHHGDFGGVLMTALDGAERSDRMDALVRAVAARRRAALEQRLAAAQATGRLDGNADLDLLCAQLVGPLFYRRFMSRQGADPTFVRALVLAVISPLRRPSQGAGAPRSGGRPRRSR